MAKTAVREEIKQGKDCLYITFPNGQGPSKLKLPKLGTARNWNTLQKLLETGRSLESQGAKR